MLIVRTSGEPSVVGFAALRVAVMTHPDFVPDMDVVHDHTDLGGYLSSSEIRAVADGATRLSKEGPYWGRLAIVAPEPALFGLARMWEAHAGDDLAARTRVFTSLDEAKEWFAATRPLPSP